MLTLVTQSTHPGTESTRLMNGRPTDARSARRCVPPAFRAAPNFGASRLCPGTETPCPILGGLRDRAPGTPRRPNFGWKGGHSGNLCSQKRHIGMVKKTGILDCNLSKPYKSPMIQTHLWVLPSNSTLVYGRDSEFNPSGLHPWCGT